MSAELDADPHSYRAVIETVRKLAGYQALSLDEAFRLLLEGEGDPDLMPAKVRQLLCDVLREQGYEEKWLIGEGDDEGRLMWSRGPWPIDHGALRSANVETFRKF